MTNELLYFAAGIGAFAAAGLTAGLVTPRLLSVETVAIESCLPEHQPTGIRFAHISDYHYEMMMVSPEKLARAITQADPNAILFTGDLFSRASNASRALESLRRIAGDRPVYMCLGNHEHKAYRNSTALDGEPDSLDSYMELARSLGFTIARYGLWQCAGHNIAAVDDYRSNSQNIALYRANIQQLLSDANPELPTILLCHSPATAGIIANMDIPYAQRPHMILCGHYHGGQVELPGHPGYTHFRRELALLPGHYRGLRVHNHIPVYINRGLGCVALPLRLASTPEITIIQS